MKEVSPIILRAGLNNLWSYNMQPKIYSHSVIFYTYLFKSLHSYFTRHFFFTLVNLKIFSYLENYCFYFYYYPTQITHRYLKMYLREQRHVNNNYMQLYKRYRSCRHKFNYKQYMSDLYTKNSFNLIYKQFKHKYLINSTLCWSNYCIIKNKKLNFFKFNKKINNNKNKVLNKNIKFRSIVFSKFLFILEKNFSIFYKKSCKFFIRHSIYLVTSTSNSTSDNSTYLAFTIYKKLTYLHKNYLFLDGLNIVLISLNYKFPDIIIFFLAREFEISTLHYKILHIVKSIMLEVYSSYNILQSFRLLITGPVNKHSRTKQYKLQVGYIATNVLKHSITFSKFFANSRFGSLGLRLWLH
jgi:hypothetical protein